MFGFKKIRDRLTVLESWRSPTIETEEPTISIPVVDAKGKAVSRYYYGYAVPRHHDLPISEAFDKLQEALGVEIQLVKGTNNTVTVNKVKRRK
jgi:hypothetical protein